MSLVLGRLKGGGGTNLDITFWFNDGAPGVTFSGLTINCKYVDVIVLQRKMETNIKDNCQNGFNGIRLLV